jgi:hypothetical protein
MRYKVDDITYESRFLPGGGTYEGALQPSPSGMLESPIVFETMFGWTNKKVVKETATRDGTESPVTQKTADSKAQTEIDGQDQQ